MTIFRPRVMVRGLSPLTDQHSTAGRAPSRVGITRTVPPGRSVAVRGYPSLRAAELLLIFAEVFERAVNDPANLFLKLVRILPILRERHPAEVNSLPDHLVDLAW